MRLLPRARGAFHLSTKPVKIPNVAIFAAGNYGEKGTYSPDDIAWMADAANKSKHVPPVTIDHKQDGPKYGEVMPGTFRAKDGVLYADLAVAPAFADTVRNKAYDKRSIELYPNRTPEGDAMPGKHTVAAVTFLGAQRPEVKGLPEIAAFASDVELLRVDFSDDPSGGAALAPIAALSSDGGADKTPTALLRELFDAMAPELIHEYIEKEIAKMTAPAVTPPPAVTPMADPIPNELDAVKAELAALKAKMESESADMAERVKCSERKAHAAEVAAFCETLTSKTSPAIVKQFSDLLIAVGPAPVVSFADGKTATDVAAGIRALATSLAPLHFGETAPHRPAPVTGEDRAAKVFSEAKRIAGEKNVTVGTAYSEAEKLIPA